MKRLSITRLVATCVLLVAIAIGCSGGGNGPSIPDQSRDASIVLTLGKAETTNGEISIPVNFSGAKELHAMSCRIGFDPAGLQPLDVQWSGLCPDDSTFQMIDRPGFVPLAIAAFGRPDGINGDGVLCTVRFKVLDSSRARCRIIDDPAYLRARDRKGRPLGMCVGGGSR